MLKKIFLITLCTCLSTNVYSETVKNNNSLNSDIKETVDISEEELVKMVSETNLEYPHYAVGIAYLKGTVLPLDYDKALFWLANSSEVESYDKADYLIAEMYSKGKTKTGFVDYQKSMFFYERAANRGNSEAKLKLAVYYSFNDVIRDQDKALFWLQESIKDKNEAATLLYYLMSIQSNDYEAIKKQLLYYEIKAEHGDRDANFALGYLYLTGKGVERNLDLSKKHFLYAMNAGMVISEILINQIDKINKS